MPGAGGGGKGLSSAAGTSPSASAGMASAKGCLARLCPFPVNSLLGVKGPALITAWGSLKGHLLHAPRGSAEDPLRLWEADRLGQGSLSGERGQKGPPLGPNAVQSSQLSLWGVGRGATLA